MACHQGQFEGRPRPVSRRPIALALAVAAAACGCRAFSRDFSVSGTITLAAPLQARAPRMNAVLFVIAKNRGGIPVAVRRIVNPQFPVSFSLNAEDLIVPGTKPGGPLSLEAQMNTHGNVGSPVRGDFSGTCHFSVYSGDRAVSINIDKEV